MRRMRSPATQPPRPLPPPCVAKPAPAHAHVGWRVEDPQNAFFTGRILCIQRYASPIGRRTGFSVELPFRPVFQYFGRFGMAGGRRGREGSEGGKGCGGRYGAGAHGRVECDIDTCLGRFYRACATGHPGGLYRRREQHGAPGGDDGGEHTRRRDNGRPAAAAVDVGHVQRTHRPPGNGGYMLCARRPAHRAPLFAGGPAASLPRSWRATPTVWPLTRRCPAADAADAAIKGGRRHQGPRVVHADVQRRRLRGSPPE